MKTEQKIKEEPQQLSAWQRELKDKFNKKMLQQDSPKKETISQDVAKKFLGDGLAK